jgi:PadR family transcriptional regulator, regulatory protein PadR
MTTRGIVAMREPTYFVLASLLDEPLHGYAIIKRAEELSGGRVRLATGTLYTALDRLSGEGYVTVIREEVVSGRTRRTYALTGAGANAVRAEAERMAAAARVVTTPAASRRDGAGAPAAPRARRVRPA